jgi:hypothetical protein
MTRRKQRSKKRTLLKVRQKLRNEPSSIVEEISLLKSL